MAQKIQQQLGGQSTGLEFPEWPRHMHKSTYERWRRKHEAAVAKSWSGFGEQFDRLIEIASKRR